jgi:hypothetical protein
MIWKGVGGWVMGFNNRGGFVRQKKGEDDAI